MNIDEITENIKQKLGDENSGKIADDIASLLVHDKALNDEIKNKNDEITRLKNDKDILVNANANLLQKLPLGKEEDDEVGKQEEEPKKPFDYRTIFKDGRFVR